MTEKLPLFLEAVRQAAQESCRQKEQEAAEYTRQRLQEAEQETHDRHRVQYQQAIRRVKQQADAELSAYRAASRHRLTGLRDAYEQKVFADAEQAVAAFTEKAEYEALLVRAAARLGALLPEGTEDAVVFLRRADEKYAAAVEKAFGKPCRVEQTDTIRLGGLRMKSVAVALEADDTLETRLEQQKPRFREQAALAVL